MDTNLLRDAREQAGWARVWPTVKLSVSRNLRRGAWYPVVEDTEPEKVFLAITNRAVAVPRRIVQVRPRLPRPHRFSVVYRANGERNPVRGTAADLGNTYAVCAHCAERLRLFAHQLAVCCTDCGHEAEVAWWETGDPADGQAGRRAGGRSTSAHDVAFSDRPVEPRIYSWKKRTGWPAGRQMGNSSRSTVGGGGEESSD
ncbi:MAG: hypothetical protein IH876_14070 [Gemmatimonadetes bacterium]|nr:hypothetical protein [Gemmatimonadota bacterium]